MKANKVTKGKLHAKGLVALAAVILLAAVVVGIVTAYDKLHGLWVEQCVVTDPVRQAVCADGMMVKGDTIREKFGIREGANLALIDFDARRREILKDLPNIRNIAVTRHLPDRVTIVVEERRPVVRLAVHGKPGATGRVADTEGVVFTCRRGTKLLPVIRERATNVTPVGQTLSRRSLAALRLIEAASDPEYLALGVLDADIAKEDFILVTLGNYSQAKIAWEGMDNPTPESRAALVKRLDHLLKAIQSNVCNDAKVWNATEPDRIYADTRESIL